MGKNINLRGKERDEKIFKIFYSVFNMNHDLSSYLKNLKTGDKINYRFCSWTPSSLRAGEGKRGISNILTKHFCWRDNYQDIGLLILAIQRDEKIFGAHLYPVNWFALKNDGIIIVEPGYEITSPIHGISFEQSDKGYFPLVLAINLWGISN